VIKDLTSAIASLQAEAALYPTGVRTWMATMAASFFSGIVFAPWREAARWVVGVMVLTAVGLVIGKAILPDLSRATIGTAVHLALWPVALFAIWQEGAIHRIAPTSFASAAYRVWLVWVTVLIVVSLALDGRAALT
jgi:uncharacterized membrane protein YjjP (DUF1212 family)